MRELLEHSQEDLGICLEELSDKRVALRLPGGCRKMQQQQQMLWLKGFIRGKVQEAACKDTTFHVDEVRCTRGATGYEDIVA